MKNDFTASNGVTVTIKHDGYLLATADGVYHATGGADLGVQALREYFTAERDEQLGRWRDPEAPNSVVYPTEEEGLIRVLDEEDGYTWLRYEEDSDHHHRLAPNGVAARYFAAHPEPAPEWHDVEAGTFWRIHLDTEDTDGRRAIAHGDGTFTDQYGIGWKADEITDATRLYPEEAHDE